MGKGIPADEPYADVWKGLTAGLIGGLVASWVMNQFQAAWSKQTEGLERSHGAQSLQPSNRQEIERIKSEPGNPDEADDATTRLASAISESVLDHKLTESEKEPAGTAVHYAFGMSMGALYGAVAEVAPAVTSGAGTAFGMAVWAGADEGILPALGLSKGPAEYPLSTHIYSLASHFVYGMTTEIVRRQVRKRL